VTVSVRAPLDGTVITLADVPDPVFSSAMVGGGLAIDPPRGRVQVGSPVAGRLLKLHPHAFVVLTDEGAGVLVHLGIDTVQLKGDGFDLHTEEGTTLELGQPVVSWDPAAVEAGGRSPICPVVVMDSKADDISDPAATGPISAGDPLFTWAR